jgi:hypothetical protein
MRGPARVVAAAGALACAPTAFAHTAADLEKLTDDELTASTPRWRQATTAALQPRRIEFEGPVRVQAGVRF